MTNEKDPLADYFPSPEEELKEFRKERMKRIAAEEEERIRQERIAKVQSQNGFSALWTPTKQGHTVCGQNSETLRDAELYGESLGISERAMDIAQEFDRMTRYSGFNVDLLINFFKILEYKDVEWDDCYEVSSSYESDKAIQSTMNLLKEDCPEMLGSKDVKLFILSIPPEYPSIEAIAEKANITIRGYCNKQAKILVSIAFDDSLHANDLSIRIISPI